jgi:hypothetical protein
MGLLNNKAALDAMRKAQAVLQRRTLARWAAADHQKVEFKGRIGHGSRSIAAR